MVKIYTAAHKRCDFITMQYNSIKKHVKGGFEYIVLNNAIDCQSQSQQIYKVCKELGVKCLMVEKCSQLNVDFGKIFKNNGYSDASNALYYPVTWAFQKIMQDNDKICFIDSDMFFTRDINLSSIMDDSEFIFFPQYRNGFLYITPALICIDTNKVKNFRELDWGFYYSQGVSTDVGGKTNEFLKNNEKINKKYLEQYTLYDIVMDKELVKVHFIINGNINYEIIENYLKNELISIKHINGQIPISEKKSFIHQIENDNYPQKIYSEYLKIKKYIDVENLPKPLQLGFVKIMDDEEFFILHYTIGSNYANYCTDVYNDAKTKITNKILNL